MRGIKIVLYRVIIRRRGYNHKVGIGISLRPVGGGSEVELFLFQKLLDVFIAYGRDAPVYHVYSLRNYIYSGDTVVLGKQSGYAQAYVTGSCNCYFHIVFYLKKSGA